MKNANQKYHWKSKSRGLCKIMLISAFLFVFLIPVFSQKNTNNNTDTLEVLFLGSSYFGCNNLPNLFYNLAIQSGKNVYIDKFIPGGLYLADHASNSYTESKINERNWDYVVLQGVGRITAYPDYFTDHPVYTSLVTLQEKILNNFPATKMLFCLPWAYEDGMIWYGWPDNYEEMQIKIFNNTLDYANDLDFPVAPVGWSWYSVLKEENYPLHYLHQSDWNHPSLRGSYLMACTIFTAIFIESTVGNAYTVGLPEDEVIQFQKTASSIVLDTLDLWNLEVNSGIMNTRASENFLLYQNYPNPFNKRTRIKYEIKKESQIEISVVDVLGEKIKLLVNEKKCPGTYIIDFNRNNLKSGLYYYMIKTNGQYQVKSMLLIK